MARNRTILFIILGATIVGLSAYAYLQTTQNNSASCANCRSFIPGALEMYFDETQEEWHPRGGATPAASLNVLTKWLKGPHHFTSHALAGDLGAYHHQHGTLTYEFMCYRYNEGLRRDDPDSLIVMYYIKPTRWECNQHKGDFLGRNVLHTAGGWSFIPEDEFQKQQRLTLQFLKDNKRLAEATRS